MANDAKTIFRSKHRRNYTVVSNEILYNPGLSGKAKWVLMYLLSKPEDWQTRIGDIVAHGTDGRDAVLSGIKELKAAGYLQKVRVTCPETKRVLRWETHVFDEPQPELQNTGKPHVEKPDSGKPQSGKANTTKYGSNQDIELTNHSRLTTTTKDERGSSSEGESASLDGEALERANAVADYIASSCSYLGEDGEVYPYRKTKALVKACEGHDKESALKAVWSTWEFMDFERSKGRSIDAPQGVICRALMDWHQPSAEYEAKQRASQAEHAQEQRRAKAIDYNYRWLTLANGVGLIEITEYDEPKQNYSYRYTGDPTPRNLNLWDLPPKYAHLTLEELSMAEVAA
jgi:hypothetical protein